jgi:teichuronic acid exporter
MASGGFRQAALSGARWTVAAKIGLQLFTWPVTIIVIRLLEPSDYGLLAMAMVTIGFVTLFSEMGLGVALVQVSALDEAMARSACAAILVCNLFIAGALFLLAPVAADWFDEPDLTSVMRVLTLELIVASVAAVPQAQLERQLQFRQVSIASMAAGVSGSVATLGLALLGFGVWALVIGNLAAACVRSTLIVAYNGRVVWPSFAHWLKPIHGLVGFSGYVLAGRALWYWYGQSDQVILARMLHASLLGYYSVASQLAMLPATKAMEVVNRVSLPILSRMHAEAGSVQPMHRRLLGLVGAYAFGACWGLAAVAPELVAAILGPKWLTATEPLMLLAAAAPLRMLSALNNTVTTAVGAPRAATIELAFASIVMPLAVIVGVWSDGLHGACVAWPLAYPAVYLLSNWLTCNAVKMPKAHGLQPLFGPITAAAAMWLCIWAIRSHYGADLPTLWLLIAEILAGAISYVLVLHLVARALALDARSLIWDLLRRSPTSQGQPEKITSS